MANIKLPISHTIYTKRFFRGSYIGIALWPLIIISNRYRHVPLVVNHESIHIRQQSELLVIPFYIIYIFHYLYNLIKYRNHNEAYRNIIFEKEAYSNENDFDYLKTRKMFACFRK